MIEYVPWYQPGAPLVQCSECFALVVEGNTPGHDEWHRRVITSVSHQSQPELLRDLREVGS